MPWFWGSKSKKHNEEHDDSEGEYDSSEYEYVTDSEGEEDEEEVNGDEKENDDGEEAHDPQGDDKAEEEAAAEVAGITTSSGHQRPTAVAAEDAQDDDVDSLVEEQVLAGHLPEAVQVDQDQSDKTALLRTRLDSGLTLGDEDHLQDAQDEHAANGKGGEIVSPKLSPSSHSPPEKRDVGDNGDIGRDDDEEEQVTSIHEKQSLLVLAAEHDRVDILQAILSNSNNDSSNNSNHDRHELLQGNVPPLHIAVSYGSINATNCLLRMGANPSVRPNVAAILQAHKQNPDSMTPIASIHRYDGLSAWELVFGKTAGDGKTVGAVSNIPPSKREGIRHAFTAEALRCIGSDEHERLDQLIQSGMPSSIDIGGKHLYDWSVEMGAMKCEELLRPAQAGQHSNGEEHEGDVMSTPNAKKTTTRKGSAVLDRSAPPGSEESLSQLLNRIDELESLSQALSICLDNLGEEVAVCSGLLLMGSGASALASHVRSLKTTKQTKMEELERIRDAWENSQDELRYWVREGGDDGVRIAAQMTLRTTPGGTASADEEKQPDDAHRRQQIKAQVAALDSKIRMLRVSIADLSEENTRNLAEVQRRGLSGGITLVRGLREEIREIEFQLGEAKSGDAECCTKISLIQSTLRAQGKVKTDPEGTTPSEQSGQQSAGLPSYDEAAPTQTAGGLSSQESRDVDGSSESATSSINNNSEKDSDRIAKGQSTALAIRHIDRGFFPLSLWQILMRIIGRVDVVSRRSSSSSNRGQPAVII